MLKYSRICVLFVIGLSVCLLPGNAVLAETLIAPDSPHDSWNAYPFGPWYSNEIPNRYQQIWDASIFSEPIYIESLAFSPLYTGDYSADVTIRLTQTSIAVNAITDPLDLNITDSLTTVFSDASYSQAITITGPDSFSFGFDFSTPFLYDPTGGDNLLMDVLINDIVYDGVTFGGFSSANVSSASNRIQEFPSGQISGGQAVLRTQFAVTVVPEPVSSTLFIVGGATLGFRRFRKKFKK